MTFNDYLFLFGGMGLVTYLPRALPLIYLAHKKMPQWLIDWLSLIPVAILSALLAPSLFTEPTARSFVFGKLDAPLATFLLYSHLNKMLVSDHLFTTSKNVMFSCISLLSRGIYFLT